MGYCRKDYIVYGYKLPYDLKDDNGNELHLYDDEKYLPYIEGHKGIGYIIILDQMMGKYVVFGEKIHSADQYNGWGFIDIETTITKHPMEVQDKLKELLNITIDDYPTLFIFSHYN